MELLERAKDKGLQSLLVMTSLHTSWTIHLEPLKSHISLDADYWKKAVRSEINSIMCNCTWEVVECPYRCKPVGCKWLFKKKLRQDGTFEKCYTQKGEDFFDTYTPILD